MLASNLERDDLRGFRRQLSTRAADLKRRMATEQRAADFAGEVHDTKDQASAEAMDDVRLADLQRDKTELADIELALVRIDVGTYGMCGDCGRPIGRKRLDAYPTAKRCHACQETYEQRAQRRSDD